MITTILHNGPIFMSHYENDCKEPPNISTDFFYQKAAIEKHSFPHFVVIAIEKKMRKQLKYVHIKLFTELFTQSSKF